MAQPDPVPAQGYSAGTPDAAGAGAGRPGRERLDALNREVNEIVARRGDRSPHDLVPDVEAAMRHHGVTPPSRDGMIQWIEEAVAATAAEDGRTA